MLSLRAALTSKALNMQICTINLAYNWHCTKITVIFHSVARKNVKKATCLRNNYSRKTAVSFYRLIPKAFTFTGAQHYK